MTVPPVPVRAPVRLGREGVRHECLRKNSCYAPLGRQSYESVWPFAFVMVVVRNEPFVTGSRGVEPHARRGLGAAKFCTLWLRELSISFERAIPPANDQGGTGMADRGQLERWAKEHDRTMLAVAARYAGPSKTAEDIRQSALLAILQKLEAIGEVSSPKLYA